MVADKVIPCWSWATTGIEVALRLLEEFLVCGIEGINVKIDIRRLYGGGSFWLLAKAYRTASRTVLWLRYSSLPMFWQAVLAQEVALAVEDLPVDDQGNLPGWGGCESQLQKGQMDNSRAPKVWK